MRAVLLCLLGLWPALSFATLSADMVVVKKSSYSLTLMKDGKEVKRYWIALGPAPKGHKRREGISVPRRSLYPGLQEEQLRFLQGHSTSTTQIWTTSSAPTRLGVNPGGMIMIHGQRNSLGIAGVQPSNWTNGCIAVLNHEMDEIWNAIEPGTPSSSSPDPPANARSHAGVACCRTMT